MLRDILIRSNKIYILDPSWEKLTFDLQDSDY